MEQIGHDYLALALQLDRHVPGFIDAYFGPSELKEQAQTGLPRQPEALTGDAEQLLAAIEAGSFAEQRRDYLLRQTRAMHALAGRLAGESLTFIEEVERYYDIQPQLVDERVFAEAHRVMDELLPGRGELTERLAAWKQSLELAPERIIPVCERACAELRRRALHLFELPEGEAVSLQIVQNEPWRAYNWYLGGYQSRIDINTDLPMRANSVVGLLSHEAYPGHHTEHAIKERRLCDGEGRLEHAVQLILAPEAVLSEGIADCAQGVIFERAELVAYLRDELYPLAGMDHIDVERQVLIDEATRALGAVSANAALLLHGEGLPAVDVQRYVERFGLRSEREAAQNMKFIQHPLWRSYNFTYSVGESLLAPLLEGPKAVANFRRLLSEPFTPTQVREWLKRAG
jgi:hypothetical protein